MSLKLVLDGSILIFNMAQSNESNLRGLEFFGITHRVKTNTTGKDGQKSSN